MSSPLKQTINFDSTRTESTQFDEAEVFANALELDDLHARKAYLDKIALTDSALRQRIERLLSYSSSNGEFLESTIATPSSGTSPSLEAVGEWLGPYRLLQQIGEGGMGTVYMAEQISPLQRRVAIKVVKPGMDSAQVMARFEAERQTLAMMEHPNIARAIDVGVSAYGRTYFVMELVKGVSITRYCDDLGLNIRQRLELFIPVCMAVQHAHQKGIIHRDLKPSNIMVAEYDGVPVPKVIDFGVAKALNQQLTSKTLFTQLGQIVGTMEYMSPEQSRLNQLDIDTRSDIYSLGVLLYELLTGTTPIQSQDLKTLSWDEIVRKVREEDAPLPSQRLSKLEQVQVIAQQRGTMPGKLSGAIQGELDWVVLKALEKQRERRYQNATELAADIRRFLQGEEVLACPPSTTYRLQKYVQKYKVAFTTAGLVSAALVLGLIGTAWQAWHASAARLQAEQQRDLANTAALRAQVAQTQAQAEAAKSAREAEITRAVANFVNNDLIAFADPNLEPDRNIQLREIVDRASERMASLQTAPLVEASIRYTLAKCYLGLGQYPLALQHANQSWKIRSENLAPSHPETLASHLLVAEAELRLSRIKQACATYEQAVELCRDIPSVDSRITIDCQHGYAVALGRLGKLDAAMDMLKKVAKFRQRSLGARHAQTLETDREIADLLFQQGEYVESLQKYETAIATMTECLGELHPLTLKSIAGAAAVAFELGDTDEARKKREFIYTRQSRVLGDEHPETLLTASNLTLVAASSSAHASAIDKNLQLLKTAQQRLGADHSVSQSIALAIAELLMDQGRAREAIDYLEKAKTALQELHQGVSPDVLRVQYRIANGLLFEGKYQTALDMFRQTLSEQEALFAPTHLDALKTQLAYAMALMSSGDYRNAEERFRELLTRGQNSDLKHHPLLAIAESKLATLESVLGRVSSLKRHEAVRNAFQKRVGATSSIGLQLDIACAESLLRFGQTAEAKRLVDEALATANTHYAETHPVRGQIQDSLIEITALAGDLKTAIKLSQELLELRKSAFGTQHPLTLKSQNQLGAILVQSGKPQQGVVLIRSAMEESQRSCGKEFPVTLTYQQNLASTLGLLSISDPSLRPESLSLYEDLLAIQARWEIDHPDWLFSQLGYAGALGQQGRLLQAERVFEKLLPKLIKVYGESHAISLRCRENYSSVLGSLGKYQAAIEQCRTYLRTLPSGSGASRKMVHAAIEYYISSSNLKSASDLFEAALKIATESKHDLDWLFGDIPFFIDALVQSGEDSRAQESLRATLDLFAERVGWKHPQTLFLAAKLLMLYQRCKNLEAARLLIERLKIDALPRGDDASASAASVLAGIAKSWEAAPSPQLVTLYSLAAQASNTANTTASAQDSSAAQPMDTDFQELAIKTLGQCASRGQLQTRRAQAWLKHSPDLDGLRDRQDFQDILLEVERATLIEDAMRLSWNLAIVGEHTEATKTLEQFATEQPELASLGTVHYLMARTWARCHEAAKREGQTDLAAEYISRCNSSLSSCEEKGFLKTPANRRNLANDENFANVRDQITNFEQYSSP